MGQDGILLELFLVGFLILLNGFFAGSEIAVVSARSSRLRVLADEGSRRARRALALKEDPDRFLATVQVGITLVGTLASAVGGVAAAEKLEPAIAALPLEWLRPLAQPVAVGAVVFTIAYLSLLIGELVPKAIAVRHAETLAVWVAPIIHWISRKSRPAVSALTWSSRLFLRLLGQKDADPAASFHSLDDLRAIAEEAARQGGMSDEILTGAVAFHERDAREVMTPRPRIAALPSNASIEDALRIVRSSGNSRYPVFEGDLDNVLGFVHARDIYEAALEGRPTPLAQLARPAIAVPGGQPATELLERMRSEGAHMALVVDEHGSTEGLITMEDLLEVIVGEIEDEHRVQVPPVRDLGEGRLEVDGSIALHELNSEHDLDLPESPTYVTVAGLVLERLGRIPAPGESVEVACCRLTVLALEGRRVARLRIDRVAPKTPREAPDGAATG